MPPSLQKVAARRSKNYPNECNQIASAWHLISSGMDTASVIRRFTKSADSTAASRETALVARAKTGDHEAFEILVRQYKDRVLNLAERIVREADAAQDVAQETFLKTYQQLPGFRGDAKFATWLYRIAVNEARGYLRAQRRRRARWEKQGALEAAQPLSAEVHEQAGPLVSLLQELPEKQRIALALFYLQELSVTDIAQLVGAPKGTIKAWLSRGRERLRRLAQERGLL